MPLIIKTLVGYLLAKVFVPLFSALFGSALRHLVLRILAALGVGFVTTLGFGSAVDGIISVITQTPSNLSAAIQFTGFDVGLGIFVSAIGVKMTLKAWSNPITQIMWNRTL
jgi:hypothetical protein